MTDNQLKRAQLKQYQSLPLSAKIRLSEVRIREAHEHFDGMLYIALSGGKDSWVLANLVWSIYPDIPAVFADTGNELESIVAFVNKKIEEGYQITVVRPKFTFDEIVAKYGYPVVNKEQAQRLWEVRNTKSPKLRDIRMNGYPSGSGKIAEKWKYLINAPFKITSKCCKHLKIKPCSEYEKATGRVAYVGTMANESRNRQQSYLNYGCNAFDKKSPDSRPMMFWTDQDVLEYIFSKGIGHAKAYGDIVHDTEGYRCTGEQRTGCKFCLFGAHKDAENRIQKLARIEPESYEHARRLGIFEVMDYMGIDHEPIKQEKESG